MDEELEKLIEVKENLRKTNINEKIKSEIISKIQELESSIYTLEELQNEYKSSRIIFDQYITRRKILVEEQIRLKDGIQNIIIEKYGDKIKEKNSSIIQKLKDGIDKNINWISILLNVTQIMVSVFVK